jgi:ABC-2 type transport system permease protein
MIGPIRAELLKGWRSWATRILIGVIILVELLLGYVVIWAILQAPDVGEGGGFGPEARAVLLTTLSPAELVGNALGMLAGLGGALALVLGALSSAREYGWRTLAVLLVQGPGRAVVVVAKAAALAVALLAMDLATFLAATVGSVAVTGLEGGTISWPPAGEVLAGLGVGWLILAAWGSVGLALGFLLRGTGLAIGLGLVYAFVIESLLSALVGASSIIEAIARGLVGVNASALATSFAVELPPELGGSPLDIEPAVAAAVLAAYAMAGIAVSAFVVRARDVT